MTERAGYFPFGYYVDFLRFISNNRSAIEVITYNDLPWGDDYDYHNGYPDELQRWQNYLRQDRQRQKKIYLLIQHDVDSVPERTLEMLREEERFGIPSNVMIFNRRINRALLRDTGQLEFTDYELDDDYLRHLQQAGFVIAYHSNAYEQSLFNRGDAENIFQEDIAALRKRFDIRYFSPHGGIRDSSGRSNSCLHPPADLAKSIRWVATGISVHFFQTFSDGGINSRRPPALELDLRNFVRTWRPGNRYRVLVHPQYYGHTPGLSRALENVDWYKDLLKAYSSAEASASETDRGADDSTSMYRPAAWSDVRITRPSVMSNMIQHGRDTLRSWAGRNRKKSRIQSPIFVRGLSRSGGTLLVTLLDAHPAVAMSYELYPKLLAFGGVEKALGFEGSESNSTDVEVRNRFQKFSIAGFRGESALEKSDDDSLKTFVARCQRGGLVPRQFMALAKRHFADGLNLSVSSGRMRFVEKCCETKMNSEGKTRWGVKCGSDFDEYLSVWPRASFVNVIRDGRDVLASQANTGNFDAVPENVGSYWTKTHTLFHELVEQSNVRAYELYYERLVDDPESELRQLCDFLKLPYDESMLQFHQQDLTIFKSNHLSMNRISVPIDQQSVGRWKKELDEDQLNRFYSTARDAMVRFGYLEAEDA